MTKKNSTVFINTAYRYLIGVLSIIILFCLTFLAILTTKIFPKGIPTAEIANQNNFTIAIISLVILLLICGALFFFNKKLNHVFADISLKKLYLIQFVAVLLFGIAVILLITIEPRADQMTCIKWAISVASDNKALLWGNQDWLNQYLEAWPHQAGWILFLSFFGSIFGFYNWTAYKLLNLLLIAVSLLCINKLSELLFNNKTTTVLCVLISTLFAPFILFVQFIYSLIPSYAFCLIAMYLALAFLKTNSTRKKIVFCIGAAASITFAIWLKSNSIVFLIAIVITITVKFFIDKKAGHLAFLALIILSYAIASPLPANVLEAKTGLCLDNGTPQLAWVVMGMQESQLGNGWYNGYTWRIAELNGGDPSMMEEQVSTDLKAQITFFANNPTEAVRFFLNKTLSEWSEPTFESLWNIQLSYYTYPETAMHDSGMVNFISEKTYYIYVIYCDIFQSLIYLFSLVAIKKLFTRMNPEILSLLLVFIGGFVLHLLWEAKSYYVLPYFMLLIPYASYGLNNVITKFSRKTRVKEN